MPNPIIPTVQAGNGTTPTQQTDAINGTYVATATTAHNMLVALAILLSFGMLLVLVAGESPEAGNAIIAFLVIIVFVQLITKVNPFIEWVNKHPLTPNGVG